MSIFARFRSRHLRWAIAKQRRYRMMKVTQRVRDESMRVNAEFGAIEDAPDA
jgi:hypothetical protein